MTGALEIEIKPGAREGEAGDWNGRPVSGLISRGKSSGPDATGVNPGCAVGVGVRVGSGVDVGLAVGGGTMDSVCEGVSVTGEGLLTSQQAVGVDSELVVHPTTSRRNTRPENRVNECIF